MQVVSSYEKLEAIADAVRHKANVTEKMTLDAIAEEIRNIGADFVVSVPKIKGFMGQETENRDEYYYPVVSSNSIWVEQLWIPFDGVLGEEYVISAFVKAGTATNFGIGFVYDTGATQNSSRYSDGEWHAVTVASNASKRVVGIGLLYGNNGSGSIKNFVLVKG